MYQPFVFDPEEGKGFLPSGFNNPEVIGKQGNLEVVYGDEGDDAIWASFIGNGK